jgi:hypothetical protein
VITLFEEPKANAVAAPWMRLLLDENVDWRLGRDLSGRQVESVPLIWLGRAC